MISCIIIEDDQLALGALSSMLRINFSKSITISGTAQTVKEGLVLIQQKSPDLIFLDIELPDDNGFSIFNNIPNPQFEVIFTTTTSEYAIPAIKHMAIDYLLKPINLMDLNAAIVRFDKKRKVEGITKESIKKLVETIKNGTSFNEKIALPTVDGFQVIPFNEILYCQASESYSYIHTISNETFIVTKTLKSLEELLPSTSFFRIHKSILLNINYIKSFSRKEGFIVTLENNLKLEVATRRHDEFINLFFKKPSITKNENPENLIKKETLN